MIGLYVKLLPISNLCTVITWFLGDSPFGPCNMISWLYILCTLLLGMLGDIPFGACKFLSWWYTLCNLLFDMLGDLTCPYFFLYRPLCLNYSGQLSLWFNHTKCWCWRLHTLLINFYQTLKLRDQLSYSSLLGRFSRKLVLRCRIWHLYALLN